ncbi:MAG: phosphatidylinositol kinase [Chlorobiaceae bacterium]|nr:phosphatidylinositol kinase [Chlorobiaceae bacterium]NTW11251.1 phosphatidylinositol kinase [Chlorobiaceae bacterium]
MRKAEIKYLDRTAGWLIQDEEGYRFSYYKAYLESADSRAVSLSLPLQSAEFISRTMIPFFDGLIPEGWLLDVAARERMLEPGDRMGLLMHCCRDCNGAVSVHPVIME